MGRRLATRGGGTSGSGSSAWGSIGGTLSDQNDLVSALSGKISTSLATVANQFLLSSAAGTWVVKTVDDIKTLLSLGGAAYLNVGTTSGTVAAGNDSRLSDSRAPDINSLTAETAIADGDYVPIYDVSASAVRKMTRANFLSAFTWNVVTGTSQSASANAGYIPKNSSLCTITLPTTAVVGSPVRIAGAGTGGWKVAQNAGQQIIFGDVASTSGTSGYLASQNQYDAVELICIVANTSFAVVSCVGNITVV